MLGCVCDCKYCVVHEYGIYILDSCWVALMSVTAFAYREELKALYYGRLKRKNPLNNGNSNSGGPNNSNPNAQGQQRREGSARAFSAPTEGGVENADLLTPPPPPPPPTAKQAVASPFNTVISTPNEYERPIQGRVLAPVAPQYKSPNFIEDSGRIPVAYVPIKAILPNYGEPQAQVLPYKNTNTTAAAATTTTTTKEAPIDQFKLPTAAKKAAASNKSTGSGYFQQMLQGKKPVASISQYQQIKDDLNRNKKKDRKQEKEKRKEKHRKHHRDKK